MAELSKEEYEMHQGQISFIGGVLSVLPLEEILRVIDRAEFSAPIIDPTLYRKAGPRLARYRRLVEALRPVRDEVMRQLKELGDAG